MKGAFPRRLLSPAHFASVHVGLFEFIYMLGFSFARSLLFGKSVNFINTYTYLQNYTAKQNAIPLGFSPFEVGTHCCNLHLISQLFGDLSPLLPNILKLLDKCIGSFKIFYIFN